MHALRTPINALPVEVLSYIITLWAFIDKDGPWSASSLCKHWRGVVLESPLAWSNITYELRMIDPIPSVWCPYAREQSQDADYVPVEGSEQDRETITTAVCKKRRPFLLWLQRTGEANFSLNIFIENRYPLMETRLFDACYALQSHLPRLRWLAISTEEEFLARTILEMIDLYASRMEGGAMNLQDVRITTRGERLRKQNPQFTSDLRGPIIDNPWPSWDTFDVNVSRSLVFEGRAYQLHKLVRNTKKFDPATLCHLTLRDMSFDGETLAFTLEHFENLQTLKLQKIYSGEWRVGRNQAPLPDVWTQVVLPRLTDLTLYFVDPRLCIELLSATRTPSLTHFSLHNRDFDCLERELKRGMTPHDAMADLGVALARFAESGPNVTAFHLSRSPVHDRHLLEILALWRGLHELTLVDLFIGPPFMRGFAASPVGSMPPTVSLCPTLQVLRLEKCDLVPGDELVLLVRSRNSPRSSTLPLDSLDVICCENIAPSHISQLRRFDPIHLSLVAVHD